MSQPTVISLFSGGGGFDVGAKAAGFEIAGALEREKEIAKVYAANFGHSPIVDSIENVQPSAFDCAPTWLHASPPCQGDSLARSGAKTEHPDRATGREVCRFIRAWKPQYFTLENVIGYSKNPALHEIENCLLECGYWVRRIKIDASDYGVPQSRIRLYVIAYQLEMPAPILPQPSMQKVGWLDAIADLLPTLRETTLAPWQAAKFAERPPATDELIANGNTSSAVRRKPWEPALTIGKSKDSYRAKVYLIPNSSWAPVREGVLPAPTVTKASTSASGGKVWRCLRQAKPSPDELVLATNARCAARFQSFPDGYQLPTNEILAGAIVGNAVPPAIARMIGESIKSALGA